MFWDGYRWIDDRSFAQSHSHKSYSRPRWPAVLIATALTIAPVIPIVVGGRSDTSLTVGNTNGAGMILAGYAYGANKQKNGPADGSQRGGSALVSYPTPLPLTTSAPASTPPTPTPTPTRAPTAALAVAPVPATPRPTLTPTATAAPTAALAVAPVPATPTPTPRPTPTPTPTPGALKVVQFSPSGTQAQFVSLMKDMTVDVIELEAGTYKGWHIGGSGQPRFHVTRAARPLLVRPAPGAAVIFDGTGVGGDGWFYAGDWTAGGSTITNYITFDPAGTGGSFTIQNYALDQQGIVSTYWTDHVAFNGFHTRGITGVAGGQVSWIVYVSSDGAHRGSNLTFNDWDVAASPGKNVSGFQTYHDPQVQGVSAARWRIDGSHVAMLSWGDASGVVIEGWTITNCDYAVSTDGVAAGTLKNNTATGSTNAPIIKAPFVDGGGNSWH